MQNELIVAKQALDTLIAKSRVHLYKPIQIAEILYHSRTAQELGIVLDDLETYRTRSKRWRDTICMQFLGRVSTSSAKYQDNLFEDNAIPPYILKILGNANVDGVVEAYIYKQFSNKHLQLENALGYCINANPESFDISEFINQFWNQPGLKRSLDKIFEIVVYALFEVLITALNVKIDIYYDEDKIGLLEEFDLFAKKVLNLDSINIRKTLNAHFNRVGVTNAADRGLDIIANFGSVVQIKHLSLNVELAEGIVNSITSDKIIIVCKSAEQRIIESLLMQIGWKSRIQSIITVDEIEEWYNKALHGEFAHVLSSRILSTLVEEIKNEFPSVGNSDFISFFESRGYHNVESDFWEIV